MAKRKPGKYDHVMNKLKPLPPEHATFHDKNIYAPEQKLVYQDRVEDAKKKFRICQHCNGDAPCRVCNNSGRRQLKGQDLAKMYATARACVESTEADLSYANLQLEALSQMIVASQESGDSDWGEYGASDRGLKLTNGDALRLQPEVFPAAKNKDDFRKWCYNNGLTHKMELPVKPMADLIKLRLLNGESEPDGIDIFVRTKIVYTSMKTEEAPNDNFDAINSTIDNETF